MKYIQDICLNFGSVDIRRVRNSECKRETTESYYSTEIGLLVAKRFVSGRGRKCRYNSLHKFRPFGSFLHFNSIEEQKHGPSYWKFNASLLDDSDLVRLITENVSVA